MKTATPPVLRATRLLDYFRGRIRYKHCSPRTELVPCPVGFVHHQMTALRVLSNGQLRVERRQPQPAKSCHSLMTAP